MSYLRDGLQGLATTYSTQHKAVGDAMSQGRAAAAKQAQTQFFH